MEIYLIFVDSINNSNKFWSAKVEQDCLTVEWGRVGYRSQTKIHTLETRDKAVTKFHNLVVEKKSKGYRESQQQMDGTRSVTDIKRAIQLLDIMRSYVAARTFEDNYIIALNEYLKIVPTPLGMQIDPHRIYRVVADVDHQKDLLSSLLKTSSLPQVTAVAVDSTPKAAIETMTISLKTISKNFWRHF